MAIIDYLQSWNLQKKLERFIKTQVQNKDGKLLSAIEPNEYSYRFKQFMEENVLNWIDANELKSKSLSIVCLLY